MKKFLEIYLGFFIALPIIIIIVLYVIGCFISWSILLVHIEWVVLRLYVLISIVFAFFLSLDK